MGNLTALPANTGHATTASLSTPAFKRQAAGINASPPGGTPPALTDPRQDIERAFEAAVYRKQTQSVSLSARFQEIAARLADDAPDGGGGAPVTSFNEGQLSFDFFAESRIEEAGFFRQRSAEAAEGLEGAQRSSFVSVSQSIAAKFEFSLGISASSLNGFSNAADSLVDTDALFGELLNYAQGLLDAADDLFNEFFTLFDQGENEKFSFADLFQQLRDALLSGDFFGQSPVPTSEGGTTYSFQLDFSFSFSGSITVEAGEVQQADPLVFDLDGDGIELTSHANGARFDLLGNGKTVNTAFVTGGDAFLALDRNGDGLINSGKELFGEQHGAANGYDELRKLDTNKDGVIDKNDKDFDKLVLFRDNGNGITEEGELITLADAGIESINLDYIGVDRRAAGGNRLAQLATFRRTNGTLGRTADALLNYTA